MGTAGGKNDFFPRKETAAILRRRCLLPQRGVLCKRILLPLFLSPSQRFFSNMSGMTLAEADDLALWAIDTVDLFCHVHKSIPALAHLCKAMTQLSDCAKINVGGTVDDMWKPNGYMPMENLSVGQINKLSFVVASAQGGDVRSGGNKPEDVKTALESTWSLHGGTASADSVDEMTQKEGKVAVVITPDKRAIHLLIPNICVCFHVASLDSNEKTLRAADVVQMVTDYSSIETIRNRMKAEFNIESIVLARGSDGKVGDSCAGKTFAVQLGARRDKLNCDIRGVVGEENVHALSQFLCCIAKVVVEESDERTVRVAKVKTIMADFANRCGLVCLAGAGSLLKDIDSSIELDPLPDVIGLRPSSSFDVSSCVLITLQQFGPTPPLTVCRLGVNRSALPYITHSWSCAAKSLRTCMSDPDGPFLELFNRVRTDVLIADDELEQKLVEERKAKAAEKKSEAKRRAKESKEERRRQAVEEANRKKEEEANRKKAEEAEAAETAIRNAVDVATEKWASGDRADAKKRLAVAADKHGSKAREPILALLKRTKQEFERQEAEEKGRTRAQKQKAPPPPPPPPKPSSSSTSTSASSSSDSAVKTECVVCMDAQVSHVCVPCGHGCLCATCVQSLPDKATCPCCRAEVSFFMRLRMVS